MPDSQRRLGRFAAGLSGDGQTPTLTPDQLASGGSAGQVVKIATGGTALEWADESGGSGAFDLHDDVTTELDASEIAFDDRILLSDESADGDPNVYVEFENFVGRSADLLDSHYEAKIPDALGPLSTFPSNAPSTGTVNASTGNVLTVAESHGNKWGFFNDGLSPGSAATLIAGNPTLWSGFFSGTRRTMLFDDSGGTSLFSFTAFQNAYRSGSVGFQSILLLAYVNATNYAIWQLESGNGQANNSLTINRLRFVTSEGSPGSGAIQWLLNLTTSGTISHVTGINNDGNQVLRNDKTWGQVSTGQLQNGGITGNKLADNAATTAKIADNAVTSAKIADSSITSIKIANEAVTEAKLDIHDAPNEGEVLGYTANGMEWVPGAFEEELPFIPIDNPIIPAPSAALQPATGAPNVNYRTGTAGWAFTNGVTTGRTTSATIPSTWGAFFTGSDNVYPAFNVGSESNPATPYATRYNSDGTRYIVAYIDPDDFAIWSVTGSADAVHTETLSGGSQVVEFLRAATFSLVASQGVPSAGTITWISDANSSGNAVTIVTAPDAEYYLTNTGRSPSWNTRTGSVGAGEIANASIDPTKFNTPGPAANGNVLSFENNTMEWANPIEVSPITTGVRLRGAASTGPETVPRFTEFTAGVVPSPTLSTQPNWDLITLPTTAKTETVSFDPDGVFNNGDRHFSVLQGTSGGISLTPVSTLPTTWPLFTYTEVLNVFPDTLRVDDDNLTTAARNALTGFTGTTSTFIVYHDHNNWAIMEFRAPTGGRVYNISGDHISIQNARLEDNEPNSSALVAFKGTPQTQMTFAFPFTTTGTAITNVSIPPPANASLRADRTFEVATMDELTLPDVVVRLTDTTAIDSVLRINGRIDATYHTIRVGSFTQEYTRAFVFNSAGTVLRMEYFYGMLSAADIVALADSHLRAVKTINRDASGNFTGFTITATR